MEIKPAISQGRTWGDGAATRNWWAKVEDGVLVVTRWVLARLRHQRFFSLNELNRGLRTCCLT